MRVTTSFPLATLRDTPSEAEIISHKLLLKGGFIRRVNSGIYAYMPLMLRVIEKISTIIEKAIVLTGQLRCILRVDRSGGWFSLKKPLSLHGNCTVSYGWVAAAGGSH